MQFHWKKNPPPTRHMERHGLKYIADNFDADNVVVCRDFMTLIKRRLDRMTEVEDASFPASVSPAGESNNTSTPQSNTDSNETASISISTTANVSTEATVETAATSAEGPTDNNAYIVISRHYPRRSPQIQEQQETLPTPRQLSVEPPPRKRKHTAKEVSASRFQTISESYKNKYKKRLRDISKKYYNKRIDTALYHLLCIIGVCPGEKLEKNKFVFDEVTDLLTAVKSKLMAKTKLTYTTASNIQEEDSQNDNGTSVNDTDVKEKIKDIETRLLACLPRDEFNSIMKLLNAKEEKRYFPCNTLYQKTYQLCQK